MAQMTTREAVKDLRQRLKEAVATTTLSAPQREVLIAIIGLEISEWFPIAIAAIATDPALDYPRCACEHNHG